MGTTARYGLPYPEDTDFVVDGASAIQALAEGVDTLPPMTQGTLANRPAAGTAGARYYARDEDRFFYDDGTDWHELLTDISGWTRADASAAYLASEWISAGRLQSLDLTPARGSIGGARYIAWLLDAATDESVTDTWRGPSGWATVNVDLYWVNAGAGSGNVRLTAVLDNAAPSATVAATGPVSTVTAAAAAQNVLSVTRMFTGQALTMTNLLNLRLIRNGSDVLDTLANDIGVVGVLITKAS